MATVLDLGLLQKFEIIFPFLLVFVIVYAILSSTKFLGENKGTHSLIALALAIMMLFSTTTREIINAMSPWFVVLFIFILFVLLAFKLFGTTDEDIMGVLKNPKYSFIIWWVVALCLIIGIGAVTRTTLGGGELNTTTTESLHEGDVGSRGTGAFESTMVNPKVLGLALILLIATFAIQKLSSQDVIK
ncbi:MAG: hypothetical protein KAU20_01195 [Nanoarchaeota archaeon]|nr:hypothetical protein [Nanoarchaeota archaeon]